MVLRRILAGCTLVSLAGCGGVPAGSGPAPPSLDQAALLTASCSGCHADSGSADGIVSLSGMTSTEIEAKLLAYRNDSSGGSSMHRMARGYTEAQIATIANALGSGGP